VHFSFAEVEAALAGLHKIAPAHRTAFASRIKNYQRQGFPPGTKTGRGRAASYNIGHILQLAFVFEFNQLGLLPERAAHTVTANLDAINRAATDCTSYKGMKSGEVFIGFDPSNISDLMDPRYADPANVSFWTYPTEAIQQLFGQWKTPRATSNNLERQGRRLAFVNVTQLISSLAADLSGGAHTEIDIIREISFWNWRASK
jgi:hypothetical protein